MVVIAIAITTVIAGAPRVSAAVDGEIFYARSASPGGEFDVVANLSGDRDKSDLSDVGADDGAVHVVWKNVTTEEIMYRRQPPSGSFGERVNLSEQDSDSSEGFVVAFGEDVHVMWAEEDPDTGEDEIYGRHSNDGGDSFGRRSNVSDSPSMHSRDPSLAASGDLVVVAFEEEVDGNDEVFARRSEDGGRSWGDAQNLSDDPDQAAEPSVALAGEVAHVVWEYRGDELDVTDDRIAYTRSTDGGASYEATVLLSADVAVRRPTVAADGDAVHVAGCVPADKSGMFDSEIIYYRSPDGGVSWVGPVNLSENSGDCKNPTISAFDGHVYVAWADTTPGRTDILLRHSGDGGEGFGPEVNVSASRGDSEDPSIAVDRSDGSVHLVWTDFSNETPPPTGDAVALAAIPASTQALARSRRRQRRPESDRLGLQGC